MSRAVVTRPMLADALDEVGRLVAYGPMGGDLRVVGDVAKILAEDPAGLADLGLEFRFGATITLRRKRSSRHCEPDGSVFSGHRVSAEVHLGSCSALRGEDLARFAGNLAKLAALLKQIEALLDRGIGGVAEFWITSEAQFAQMMCSFGLHSGAPCTIRRLGKEGIPPPDEPEPKPRGHELHVPREWRKHAKMTPEEMIELPLQELRDFAFQGLGIVGASKVPGGKVSLIELVWVTMLGTKR